MKNLVKYYDPRFDYSVEEIIYKNFHGVTADATHPMVFCESPMTSAAGIKLDLKYGRKE